MIELRQTLRMSQQLVMTPQLQQAIKLLQLGRMEMVELVQQEMVENPVLEEEVQEPSAEETAASGAPEAKPAIADGERTNEVKGDERAVNEIDWEQYLEHHAALPPTPGGIRRDTDLPPIEANLTRREDLTDHLMWQLMLSGDFDAAEKRVAACIVGDLADDGYFREPCLARFAERLQSSCPGATESDCLAVMRKVQRLDPVGVAARDLAECLLIQAEHYGELTANVEMLIRFHIPNLEKKNYQAIARDLKVDVALVVELAQWIREELNPRPGAEYNANEPIYVTPDVYIHKLGDEYFVVPNDDGLPKLKISSYYRKAMKGPNGARSYIQEKLRSAQWLIRSIQQRQRTIIRVTESIVKFQREFFDRGVDFLRPLILRDVADDIGMHESTVSRVTTNKYVSTPRGIFDLKYFFNAGISRTHGSSVASESVKTRIKQLVAHEDPKLPYSDQRIVALLREQNIEIARRTVAKYRNRMGILPSSQRKQLF